MNSSFEVFDQSEKSQTLGDFDAGMRQSPYSPLLVIATLTLAFIIEVWSKVRVGFEGCVFTQRLQESPPCFTEPVIFDRSTFSVDPAENETLGVSPSTREARVGKFFAFEGCQTVGGLFSPPSIPSTSVLTPLTSASQPIWHVGH